MGSARKTKAGGRGKKKRDGRVASAVKSPWFLAVGGVIALLSLVAAVFGPVPDLFKDETTVANFVAEPVNKHGVTNFVLPLDAPLEEMPPGSDGYCTDDVLEWLRKVGTEVPPYQRIAIRNSAEDGAMLSLSNVRAVDVRKSDSRPVISFECPDGGAGEMSVLKLRLDRDGQAQEYDLVTQETRPFAFNLEPGERGSLEVWLLGDRAHSYSGRLVVDVSTGGKTETVDLPLNGRRDGFDRISAGEFGKLVVLPGMTPGTLLCRRKTTADPEAGDPDARTGPCTVAEVRSTLAGLK